MKGGYVWFQCDLKTLISIRYSSTKWNCGSSMRQLIYCQSAVFARGLNHTSLHVSAFGAYKWSTRRGLFKPVTSSSQGSWIVVINVCASMQCISCLHVRHARMHAFFHHFGKYFQRKRVGGGDFPSSVLTQKLESRLRCHNSTMRVLSEIITKLGRLFWMPYTMGGCTSIWTRQLKKLEPQFHGVYRK